MSGADVTDLLADAAAAAPTRVALVEGDGGRSWTWQGLEQAVARFATGLGRHGIVAGQRVLLASANRAELVIAHLGTLRAQAVSVPVNPRSSVGDLARMIADSGARLVLVDATALTTAREALALIAEAAAGAETELEADLVDRQVPARVVVLGEAPGPGETAYDDLVAPDVVAVPRVPDPEKLACLLYTAGTSGRPRAAMLTHRALLANVEQVAAVEPGMIRADDVVLCMLPVFHIYGLNAVLGACLRQRARIVLQEGFDPQGTLDLIEDEAVSVVPVAPPVFAHWLRIDDLAERLGPVRVVLSGSAPLAQQVIDRFTTLTGIPVHQGYGLTEASPVVTTTLAAEDARGTLGVPLQGVEVRVVDESGRPPEGGDPGEVEIRGDNLFSGYWPGGEDGPDDSGWWATGDVGYLDDHGNLTLVDRLREVVQVSGFPVYPREVEDVLRGVPGVRQAAVIGVADESTGSAVVAYVVPTADAAADPEILVARAQAACAEELARFKQPARFEVVEQLPTTPTGRVQKGKLRGLERRRTLGLVE